MAVLSASILVCLEIAAQPSAISGERILPIRGEHLVEKLRRPIPALKNLQVSPHGSKALFIESSLRPESGNIGQDLKVTDSVTRLLNDEALSDSVDHTLCLLDLTNGKKFSLTGYEKTSLRPIFSGEIPKPQWSDDDRHLAFLEKSTDGVLSLAVWNTDRKAPPVRTRLDRFSAELMGTQELYFWSWIPERHALVVGLRQADLRSPEYLDSIAKAGGYAGQSQGQMTGFVWLLSQAVEDNARRQEAEKNRTAAATQLRVFDLNLATGTWREMKMDAGVYPNFRTGADARYVRVANRKAVVFDATLDVISRLQDTWKTRTTLFAVDVEAGAVREFKASSAATRDVPKHPALAGLAFSSYAVSADGRTAVSVMEDVNTPPDVHVWSKRSPQWRKMTNYAADVGNLGVGRVEKLAWRSKDNRFDVEGFLAKPQNFDPRKRYPMLVVVHGGPGAPLRDRFDPLIGHGGVLAHVFAAEGYLVFLPNFRGDQGGDLGDSREFGEAMQGRGDVYDYDIDGGVDHLVATGYVDPERIGIFGHSHGGKIVMYAISHTQRYKAAIISDGAMLQQEVSMPIDYYTNLLRQDGVADRGYDQLVAHAGFDPVQQFFADAYRIRTPLLLRSTPNGGASRARQLSELPVSYLQGPRNAIRMVEVAKIVTALTRNKVPVELLVDQDKHWIQRKSYLLEYQSRLLQWLDYFVLGRGDNPLPAMKSPVDYGQDLELVRTDGR